MGSYKSAQVERCYMVLLNNMRRAMMCLLVALMIFALLFGVRAVATVLLGALALTICGVAVLLSLVI